MENENLNFEADLQGIKNKNYYDTKFAAGICMIEKESFRILYFNEVIQQFYPDIQLGEFCYRTFRCKSHECNDCSLKSFDPEKAQSVVLNSCIGNRFTNIMVSELQREDNIEAYVLQMKEDLYGTEELNELKKCQYDIALKNSYSEIYECDLQNDTLSMFFQNTNLLDSAALTGVMSQDILQLADSKIHEEDRQLFLQLFHRTSILKDFYSGKKEILGEYRRMGLDGKYHWISLTIVPIKKGGRFAGQAIILICDISEKKKLEADKQRVEEKAKFIFSQSCDELTEINLKNWMYKQTTFSKRALFPIPEQGDYRLAFQLLLKNEIYPQDFDFVKDILSAGSLEKYFASDQKEKSCRYRIVRYNGTIDWLESRIFFRRDEEAYAALIITRNINQQKTQELEQKIAEQYDRALRGIYDELFEINLTRDTYKIIYHAHGKYVVPAEQGNTSGAIRVVCENMIHPEDRERFRDFLGAERIREDFCSGRENIIAEFRKLRTDGSFRWASFTLFPVERTSADDEIFLCFIMDVDEKKHTDEVEEQNRLLEKRRFDDERYRIIVEQTDTFVFEWSKKPEIRYLSPKMIEEFDGHFVAEDMIHAPLHESKIYYEDLTVYRDFYRNLVNGDNFGEMSIRLKHKKRGFIWCKIVITCIRGEHGELLRMIGTLNDVDEAVKSVKRLRYQAEFDMLTGIYNIQAFYHHSKLFMNQNPNSKYAIVRMDINRFKYVNELYGMEEGDKVLKYIANILKEMVPLGSIYCRVAGDVFCLCVAFSRTEEIEELVSRIGKAVGNYGLEYKAIPYFGICIVDDQSVSVSILCDWANLALKTIKGNILCNWKYYDESLRSQQLFEHEIEDDMSYALQMNQFIVYLQPKFDIRTGKIVGVEALSRWDRGEKGFLTPDQFIPIFENNGFIVHLDEYVWEVVFKMLRRWLDAGCTLLPVSVNVSRMHIYNPGFRTRLISLFQKYHIPTNLIELELTESIFVEDVEGLYQTMEILQKSGFLFSMDDFGSGYSSLNMLKSSPVNTIKLDREFFNEGVASEKGKTVIKYTIELANKLNLGIIAEGVETQEQVDFLLDAGCTIAQGYYYSKPVPIKEFEKMMFGHII